MNATLQKEPRANQDRTVEFVSPEVNVFETNEGYVLQAEMPGVNKDGLEVTLEGNEITIVGHRNPQPLAGEILFRESQDADFRRVFELDPAIDTSKISAKIEQGVVEVILPKSERVKPRKITVS